MPKVFEYTTILLLATFGTSCQKVIVGCMDPNYSNYDPDANENDGCCCTIVRGNQDGVLLEKVLVLPFPLISDTIEFDPMLSLQATIERMDQTAEGPCGCLRYKGPWDSSNYYDGLYNSPYQSYDTDPGAYGPRSICYTYISWLAITTPSPLDTAIWNLVAAENEIDSTRHPLLVSYAVRFSSTGLNDFAQNYTDTLYAAMHPNTNGGLAITWGSNWFQYPRTTQRISGTDLPCSDYLINSESVTIDSVSVRFLP